MSKRDTILKERNAMTERDNIRSAGSGTGGVLAQAQQGDSGGAEAVDEENG